MSKPRAKCKHCGGDIIFETMYGTYKTFPLYADGSTGRAKIITTGIHLETEDVYTCKICNISVAPWEKEDLLKAGVSDG